ncbi:MAG: hypothetical protein R2932_27590 [Caldilineaceae bacterium]
MNLLEHSGGIEYALVVLIVAVITPHFPIVGWLAPAIKTAHLPPRSPPVQTSGLLSAAVLCRRNITATATPVTTLVGSATNRSDTPALSYPRRFSPLVSAADTTVDDNSNNRHGYAALPRQRATGFATPATATRASVIAAT